MKKTTNISFLWTAIISLIATFQVSGQNSHSISGKINYTGPQKGNLIVRAWQQDLQNKTLVLDGNGDFVKTEITDLSGSEITIQYWFKGVSNQSAVRIQSGAGWIVAGWNGLHILQNDDGTNGVTIGEDYKDGEWHHVTLSWKKATEGGFASYVDGKLVASRDSSNNDIPVHDAPVYLGTFNALGEYTSGSLDEVAIWNRSLTAQEIELMWNKRLSGGEDGLVAFWNFDNDEDELLDLGPSEFSSEFGGDAIVAHGDIPRMGIGFTELSFESSENYLIENILEGNNYKVFAFIDVNGNGVADITEPYGSYNKELNLTGTENQIDIVLKEAPVILSEPDSVKKTIGEEVVLSVDAAGTAPINYIWKFNNEPIEGNDRVLGVSTDTLTIKNFKKSDEGIYSVVLENEIGNAETSGCKISEFIEGHALTGIISYSGKGLENKVLSLDGDGDYVVTPIKNLSGDELTIQYWFKGESLQSAVRQQSSGWIVAGWNGKHILQNDDGINGLNIGEESVDGDWHHVTLVWSKNSPSGFASYLDGELVDSRDSSDVAIPDYDSNVYFGCFNGVAEFTNGQLDEIAIWNRALNADEVKNSFKTAFTGKESGLVGYWDFDDGDASDKTGNGYDGELNGDAKIVEALNTRELPGGFELVNVISGQDYVLTSFLDLNGNGKQDHNEPFAVSEPFNVDGEMANLNMELLDPVIIATNPKSTTLQKGAELKINVEAAGGGPFNFTWLKNGKEIDNGDDRVKGNGTHELTIKNMQLSDAGVYSVQISNQISEAISRGAFVDVLTDDINDGLIGHWKLDGNDDDPFIALDATENFLDAELMEFLEGDSEWWVDGKIGQSVNFSSEKKQFAIIEGYENTSNALTISAWVWAGSAEPWGSVLKNWGDAQSGQFHFGLNASGNQLSNFISTNKGKAFSVTEEDSFPLESWQHVATTVDGLKIKLYRNGQLVAETSYEGILMEDVVPSVGIAAKLNDDGSWTSQGSGGYWNGKMDDIGLWGRSLTHAEIMGIYQSGLTGNDLSKAIAVEIQPPADVALELSLITSDEIRLSWHDESSQYTLQQSDDLKKWNAINIDADNFNNKKEVRLNKNEKQMFFRLMAE